MAKAYQETNDEKHFKALIKRLSPAAKQALLALEDSGTPVRDRRVSAELKKAWCINKPGEIAANGHVAVAFIKSESS